MISPDDLVQLRTAHKRIAHVRDKDGAWEVVYRKPSHAEYKRFRSALHNEATKPDATEQLARVCVVYPSREAFDALLEDYPAIADASGDAIGELVGFTVDKSAK